MPFLQLNRENTWFRMPKLLVFVCLCTDRDKLLTIAVTVFLKNTFMCSTAHWENVICENTWKYTMHTYKGTVTINLPSLGIIHWDPWWRFSPCGSDICGFILAQFSTLKKKMEAEGRWMPRKGGNLYKKVWVLLPSLSGTLLGLGLSVTPRTTTRRQSSNLWSFKRLNLNSQLPDCSWSA